MGDIIRNISRVDQAVCWPDFTAPYSTKPSAELSSRFRLTLSCCSTTSTVDEVQWCTVCGRGHKVQPDVYNFRMATCMAISSRAKLRQQVT